jgi:hypothetical protein
MSVPHVSGWIPANSGFLARPRRFAAANELGMTRAFFFLLLLPSFFCFILPSSLFSFFFGSFFVLHFIPIFPVVEIWRNNWRDDLDFG